MREKIVLGLSGGVDSAVSAALLRDAGYEVHGLYLDLGLGGKADAVRAADDLGIPLTVRDIRPELEKAVCAPFAEGYLRGETPSPCILCNPSVKFPSLFRLAKELGAEKVATGHYARCENGALYQGKSANDQSYMLSRLTLEQLKRCVFPLGGMEKTEIRKKAEELGLSVAHKADSMEICFIPDGDYAAFIESRGTVPPPGDFIAPDGAVLGRHKGIHHYTLGQRRGLNIALGRRVFVSAIDPINNTVTLSDDDDLYVTQARAKNANWLITPPPDGFDCRVRVRHSRVSAPARIVPDGDGFVIHFAEPTRAPTPGQAAVGYIGEQVVCSGWLLREDTP
ncbi:MAG: tRNA 2-thiouridine(34) synthase MnmA [Candidatus Heteroscillospira sp.]|jgi:tRNA-specific 2-thiouridylase